MHRQLRMLLIGVLVASLLLSAACGKAPHADPTMAPAVSTEDSTSVEQETAAAAEPASEDTTATPVAEPAEQEALSSGAAAVYLAIVNGLKEKYGEGRVSDNGNFLLGFAFARLMDLDGDGSPELLCAYQSPEQPDYLCYVNEYAVYGSASMEPLFPPREISNFGNGDAPGVEWLAKDGRVYLEDYMGAIKIVYSHLAAGKLIPDFTYEETFGDDGVPVTALNGAPTDQETASAAIEDFEAGGEKTRVEFFDYEGTDALETVLADTRDVIDTLTAAAGG